MALPKDAKSTAKVVVNLLSKTPVKFLLKAFFVVGLALLGWFFFGTNLEQAARLLFSPVGSGEKIGQVKLLAGGILWVAGAFMALRIALAQLHKWLKGVLKPLEEMAKKHKKAMEEAEKVVADAQKDVDKAEANKANPPLRSNGARGAAAAMVRDDPDELAKAVTATQAILTAKQTAVTDLKAAQLAEMPKEDKEFLEGFQKEAEPFLKSQLDWLVPGSSITATVWAFLYTVAWTYGTTLASEKGLWWFTVMALVFTVAMATFVGDGVYAATRNKPDYKRSAFQLVTALVVALVVAPVMADLAKDKLDSNKSSAKLVEADEKIWVALTPRDQVYLESEGKPVKSPTQDEFNALLQAEANGEGDEAAFKGYNVILLPKGAKSGPDKAEVILLPARFAELVAERVRLQDLARFKRPNMYGWMENGKAIPYRFYITRDGAVRTVHNPRMLVDPNGKPLRDVSLLSDAERQAVMNRRFGM